MNSRMLIVGLAAVSMMGMRANAQTCDSGAAVGTSTPTAAVPVQNAGTCAVCAPQPGELFCGLRRRVICQTCLPCAVKTAATENAVPAESVCACELSGGLKKLIAGQTCSTCAPCAEAVNNAVPAESVCVCELSSGLKRLAAAQACVPCAAAENVIPQGDAVVPMTAPDNAFCPACTAISAEDADSNAVPAVNCASCTVAETGSMLPVQNASLACEAKETVRGVRCMISGLFGALAEAATTPPPCSPFALTSNCNVCGVNDVTAAAADNIDLSEVSGTEQPELPESPHVEE